MSKRKRPLEKDIGQYVLKLFVTATIFASTLLYLNYFITEQGCHTEQGKMLYYLASFSMFCFLAWGLGIELVRAAVVEFKSLLAGAPRKDP